MDQMYKQGGVTQITASRSKGQSAPELFELLKKFTGYAAHHDPPVPATPTKLQAVDASSQKKRPANHSPMSPIASSNPMKKQRTSASADLDGDNGNFARVMMSPYFQEVVASAVKAALDSAVKADVAAFEYDDDPCSSSTNRKFRFL